MKTCIVCGKQHSRKSLTCSDPCAGIDRRRRDTAASLRNETNAPREFQQMTVEEEIAEGRDGLRRILHAFADLPADGSALYSPVVVYRPGDPGFNEIAATVTHIGNIPAKVKTKDRVWG